MRRHNVQLWAGAVIVLVSFAILFIGPLVVGHEPNAQDLNNAFGGSSSAHLLGTDQLGRDMLARLLYGGRTDIVIAMVAVLAPLVAGTLIGAVAGYFGGWTDAIIMRVADLVSAFPFYVLVIALVFVLGSGALSIFIAISLVSWVAYARIVRGETMVLREKEFIAACRTSGLRSPRIIGRHVIPNVVGQAIIFAMSDIVLNIGVIVTLSYFGLGIVPPSPDWGQMMSDGQQYLASGRYALTLFPGLAIVVVGFGFALLGDGITTVLRGRR